MTDRELSSDFERDITVLQSLGIHSIVVHGGGPMITGKLAQSGIKSEFVGGVRVTDDKTMAVVHDVLREVNTGICEGIRRHGGEPVSLTEGEYVQAVRMQGDGGRSPGRVGLVSAVSPELAQLATDKGKIPVLAPLAPDGDGNICNINADYAAEGIATKLRATKLILMTNTPGVLDKDGELISTLDSARSKQLIADGTINEGMLPKVQCALKAVEAGVSSAHIIDGRIDHAVLLELLTNEGVGTLVS